MTDRFTVENAVASLQDDGRGIYGVLLEHGTMQLGYYRPRGSDPQQPHARDEVYIVQSGHGVFIQGGKRQEFQPGEALFVPAGVEHRFEEFSGDFAAWVIFYGPDGGEAT